LVGTSQGHEEEVGGVMFTIEVKVNSDVIISITGWNRGYVRNNVKPDTCRYGYSYAKENELHKNEVRHRRSDGMDKLIILILKDVEKQRKKLNRKE
jgi:hypothetical protein